MVEISQISGISRQEAKAGIQQTGLDSEEESFYEAYHRAFGIVRADTEELKEKAFRLRYDVYSIENEFERANKEHLERDCHDGHAVHFLLIHKDSGLTAGTVRAVLPDAENPISSFPMQALCDHSLLQRKESLKGLCQISRLCMAAHFRRRPDDGTLLPAYHPPEILETLQDGKLVHVHRRIPYAPLGLFAAVFETALDAGIPDCVAMIEPSQLRNFHEMGLSYKVLGPRLEYHGLQQPVVFNIKTVFDNMLIDRSDCWEVISDDGRLHKKANDIYKTSWENNLLEEPQRDSKRA